MDPPASEEAIASPDMIWANTQDYEVWLVVLAFQFYFLLMIIAMI